MRVLFTREQVGAEMGWDGLAGLLPGWELGTCEPDAVARHLDGTDVICPIGARIGAEIMARGQFGLIQQFGVGLDSVDVPAATEHGVWVARIPGDESGNADSVAELAVLHLLALSRRLDGARAALDAGDWGGRPLGRSLVGATVLIIGLGTIGQAVARRLAPFGPRLTAIRAHPGHGGPPEVAEVGGTDRLPDLLGQADAVVCCAALHDGSAKMLGEPEFAAMKPGALLVNIARGGLIDEPALLAALESGQVGGAGLDVFSQEPPDPASPLLRHPGVIATPHVGWMTSLMIDQTARAFAANLRRWESGEQPRWTVNDPSSPRRRT